MTANEVIDWLAKNIGSPCEGDWDGKDTFELIGPEWCHDHCTKVKDSDCWKEYFKKLRKKRESE